MRIERCNMILVLDSRYMMEKIDRERRNIGRE